MDIIWQVIICSLAGGVLSLAGGIFLALHKHSRTLASYATAFAAGALIAAAFMDLLPEAVEDSDPHQIMLWTMVGLTVFFLLESFLNWFHSHGHHDAESAKPINAMLIIGDTIHNFIDGIAIAAGFLVSPESGLIVTLAVVAHEIPQEIGDFGVMLHNGMARKRVILANILSALASTVAAVTFYLIGNASEISLAPLLGVVAGFFIYITASDIIPTIHREKNRKAVTKKSLWLIVGIVLVSLVIVNLHSLAPEHGGQCGHGHTVRGVECKD